MRHARSLLSNTHAVNLDDELLSAVMLHRWLELEIPHQSVH